MYIKLKRNGTRNSEYSFLCVLGVRGGGDGRGDSFQTVCRGGGEGTGKVIHLFQTALKNLATKYFH